jgi:2-dehydro-3-deoxygalactonokinase
VAQLIALDWGTSSLRAYLLADDGAILERKQATNGILAVKDGAFDAAMEELIGEWPSSLPVIASGMITSRQGWVEVTYVSCPADVSQLAMGVVEKTSARGRHLHFVPGMSREGRDGIPDVMRGEEVQVFGAVQGGQELFVAPGTHSKWIDVRDGAITGFATYMTGEVYAVMRQHSILGRLMAGDTHDEAAFKRGAEAGLREPAALLHRLFSARTLGLFGKLLEASLASYLSGLLIGAETGHAMQVRSGPFRCTILGNENLSRLYELVLKLAGIECHAAEPDVVVKGLHRIAASRNLLT